MMKTTPTAPGYDEVMVAGDPEWRMEARAPRERNSDRDGQLGRSW